jgi:hypothetical protein
MFLYKNVIGVSAKFLESLSRLLRFLLCPLVDGWLRKLKTQIIEEYRFAKNVFGKYVHST